MGTRTTTAAAAVLAIFACAACASDSSGSSGALSSSDVADVQQLAEEADSAVNAYGDAMMDLADAAACQAISDQYDSDIRPRVSRIGGFGGDMDGLMRRHEGSGFADVECLSAVMMDELDYHHTIACQGDLAQIREEARRHTSVMGSYATHLMDRCNQMARGLDTGQWGFTPMINACETWDGCCSEMMHHGCGGMMMMSGRRCD